MSADRAEIRRVASTLLHDVGKYVARTARNLRDGAAIEGPLASMLRKDVFETHRGRRASLRFEELAAELAALGVADPRIDVARERLRAIDALEERVGRGDPAALADVAQGARAVEDALRAMAKDLGR